MNITIIDNYILKHELKVHYFFREQQPQQRRRGSQRVNQAKSVPTPAPAAKRDAWAIPPIQCYEPEDGVFYAQMGPTGGKRGYPAITGKIVPKYCILSKFPIPLQGM